jgi:sec-independent protein translocase protein TatA
VHFSSPAEIFGVDGLIILVVVALVLFGSTQIPKLARSLGSAQKEFKQGLSEGETPVAQVAPVVVVTPPAPVAAGTPSGTHTHTG